ncbi:MarR family winged helix-turn-helix transcriptional regulator [Micrococcus endophyticus]|uniref:MarR family winged helix-turn-helix transcriptional regulator n=1 Tax=Micrococcus endophyticus TaxID=455343 RepID=UPI0035A91F79
MGEARRGTEQARLLRQVVSLHQQVRILLCRLMAMHDTDYAAIALLMRGPQGPSALASSLGLSTAAVTAMVDRLEAAGHAERLPHAQDRRRTVVRLMPESQHQVQVEVDRMADATGHLLADLDERERAAVARYLGRTRDALERWRDDVAARVAARDAEAVR